VVIDASGRVRVVGPSSGFRGGWGWLVVKSVAQAYLVLLLSLAAMAMIPSLLGGHSSVVQSGSMRPHINVGDVVLTTDIPKDLPVPIGRVVQFHSPASAEASGMEKIRLHRVVNANDDGTFVTAGDANRTVDSTPIRREQVIGQGRLLVPWVGLPGLWFGAGDLGKLGLWLVLTLIALVVVGSSSARKRSSADPQPPGDPPPSSEDDGPMQANPPRRRGRQAVAPAAAMGMRRGSTAAAAGMVLLLTWAAVLPVGQATAGFSGRTVNAGNSFATGLWNTYRNYRAAIALDDPWAYYPVDEAPGAAVAADYSGAGRDANYGYFGGVTNGTPGALINETNRAISLNGTAAATFATPAPAVVNPTTFSVEMWFKTAGSQGGELAGFGDARTGTSSKFDRVLYVGSDGKLNFGASTVRKTVVTSVNRYNDSTWHHVVATLGTPGMALYVDGNLVGRNTSSAADNNTGYWRIGGDSLAGWPKPPANPYFAGSIDELSIYNTTALNAARVKAHYDSAQPSTTGNYAVEVSADTPSYYYHLEESAPDTMFDSGSRRQNTTYPSSGVTYNVFGVLPKMNNRAATFQGTFGSLVSGTAQTNPQVFSTETWFKTTSTRGGQLIGFGSSTSIWSSFSHDRHLYMTDGGQLVFGVYPGTVRTITSPGSYNDGGWHHTVATLSTEGMRLYVDGKLVSSDATVHSAQPYSGYWQIGAGLLSGWPNQPSSDYFDGTLDEVAVYSTALTAAQIANHYRAR